MPKKVVLSGYYGFDNFGDEAILSVLCKKLKALDAEITVLSANPLKTQKLYGVNSVKNFDIINLIKTISNSDILFSGGGSLLQDVTSIKSLLYYSFVIAAALFFKKKVVIFAQGIGPLNKCISRFIVKNLLKHADYISVRDEKSLSLMKNWNIEADLVNDPVFSIDVPVKNNKGIVGIQLRDFHSMNDYLLKKLAVSVCNNFHDKVIRILVFQNSIDYDVCIKFENFLKEINPKVKTEIIKDMNQEEFVNAISELEYLIAMRFHAIIIALKAGIPSLGINYDIKVEKLAREASIPLISMNVVEDINDVINQMKALNPVELRAYSNLKSSEEWTRITSLVTK